MDLSAATAYVAQRLYGLSGHRNAAYFLDRRQKRVQIKIKKFAYLKAGEVEEWIRGL